MSFITSIFQGAYSLINQAYIQIQTNNLPSFSKEEKLEIILEYYKELIALEKKREANPFFVKIHSEWLPLKFAKGDKLPPPTIQRAGYYSDYSKEEYEQGFALINNKYEKFPLDDFVYAFEDDQEIITIFGNLINEYEELNKKNKEHFEAVLKEINEFRRKVYRS